MSKIISTNQTVYEGKMINILKEIVNECDERLDINFCKYAIKNFRMPVEIIKKVLNDYYCSIDCIEVDEEDLIINKHIDRVMKDYRMEMFVYLFSSCKDLFTMISKAEKNDFNIKTKSKVNKVDFILEDKYAVNVNYLHDAIYIAKL